MVGLNGSVSLCQPLHLKKGVGYLFEVFLFYLVIHHSSVYQWKTNLKIRLPMLLSQLPLGSASLDIHKENS